MKVIVLGAGLLGVWFAAQFASLLPRVDFALKRLSTWGAPRQALTT